MGSDRELFVMENILEQACKKEKIHEKLLEKKNDLYSMCIDGSKSDRYYISG